MKIKLPSWEKLNEYALEYHAEVQLGYGTQVGYYDERGNPVNKEEGTLIDNRSAKQKELVDKIITGAYPYLHKIATNLLNKSLEIANTGNYVSLRRFQQKFSVEDLVNEAAINVIQCLKNHNPDKGSLSTFLSYNAIATMYRYATNNSGMIRIPVHTFEKVVKVIDEKYREQSVSQIMEKTRNRAPTAYAIYCGVTNKYVNIHGMVGAGKNKSSSPSNTKFEEVYLPDENAETDKGAQQEELEQKVQKVLATLNLQQGKVLKMRFGIGNDEDRSLGKIGKEMNLTRERIRQIEVKALQKLRHPSRAKYLKVFME